jgi:S1-C subfamily serine protease
MIFASNHPPGPSTRPSRVVLSALALGLLAGAAFAQRVVVEQGPAGGFVIRELGALVGVDPAGDAARVEHVADAEQRPAAYREVDLAGGDRILAVNGKRVRSGKECEAAYAAVAVGQQVELGVERSAAGATQRRIVRFAKADPTTLPQPQMRMVRIEGAGDGEVEVMPALGVVLRHGYAKGSPVEVAAVLPAGAGLLREGDRLVSADGEPIARLADFTDRWDALAIGDTAELVVENAGARRTVTVTKKEPPPGVRMRHRTDGQ